MDYRSYYSQISCREYLIWFFILFEGAKIPKSGSIPNWNAWTTVYSKTQIVMLKVVNVTIFLSF
jgi:hypothetical protein